MKTRIAVLALSLICLPMARAAVLRGRVLDFQSRAVIPARVYIQGEAGGWYFPESEGGSAIPFKKQIGTASVEMHTTLTAHPFKVEIPPGRYQVTVEQGKEYLPLSREVVVKEAGADLEFPLVRWVNMAEQGWYSGDTHTHRTLEELPNLVLAENVNVAWPMSYWTLKASESPVASEKSVKTPVSPGPTFVDPSHLVYPLNTEYELFNVNGKPHTLGAVLLLNHQKPLDAVAPPLGRIADDIHAQGGLIAFDKHAWEWSMMLPAIAHPDLFDLANNHMWRTRFQFKNWGVPPPAWMKISTNSEWGWVNYGFQTYYTLLDCGFKMAPTGATGAGVHPAPFGFGRVYVHLPDGFQYDRWVAGLREGRSFVTTGPMLWATANNEDPGKKFEGGGQRAQKFHLEIRALNPSPLARIEIIVNGIVHDTIHPANRVTEAGAYESRCERTLELNQSGWFAVRAIDEREFGDIRFAHCAPFFLEVPGKPWLPRAEEVQFLVDRMESELKRNSGVLSEPALAEFRKALQTYRSIRTFDPRGRN